MNLTKRLDHEKGFTLVELLIVVVILAVLAGLAIPVYQAQVERSRAAEAIQSLNGMRASMLRYFSQNGTYLNATVGAGAVTDIDYNPNVAVGGQTVIFSYGITAQAAGTFTLTATRLPTSIAGTVTINQLGSVVRSGVYI